MTAGVRFPDEAALRIALSSGWVPADVAAAPAMGFRLDDGLVVVPSVALPAAVKKQLRKVGIEPATAAPVGAGDRAEGGAVTASCWAELVAAQRTKDFEATTVVFLVPSAKVATVAAEILRLGCPRQELRMLDGRALLRVVDPPYYAVARALDGVDDVRAFRPTASGRVLVELGFEHPLAAELTPRTDAVVLVPGQGPWVLVPDGPWEDLGAHVRLELAAEPTRPSTLAEVPRITVPLRLARAARPAAATTFVLPLSAEARLHAFVRAVPEDVVDGLLFAVTVEGTSRSGRSAHEGRIVLRARPGVVPGAAPLADAEAFAPHPQVPNVLLPVAATLEPPVRREHLVTLLAPDPSDLAFVRPSEGGGVVVERLAESAFLPLGELVDWIVDRAAGTLETWKAGVTFDFDVPIVAGADEGPVEREPSEARARRPLRVSEPEPEPPVPAARPKKAARKAKVEAPVLAAIPSAAPTEAAAALSACEAEFLALEGPPDAPERLPLYARMGELLAALDRRREATLCWNRAVWEADDDEAVELATRWAGAAPQPLLDRLLDKRSPTGDEVRSAVACLAAGARAEPTALARWLDKHDDALDVRSLWLGWRAASRLAGGDRLALARARDTILVRLSRGLSLERDVPTFLRFVGDKRGGRNADRLAKEIEGLYERLARAPRTRSPVEAKPELTRAYVAFVVAYGLGRLGAADRAHVFAAQGLAALDLADPVHGFLARAFQVRIQQAAEGAPADAALPTALAAELDGLERFLRYKVDRLRQASAILEPTERLDPIAAFQRAERDPRGDRFAGLRGLDDRAERTAKLTAIVDDAEVAAPEERARLFDGVLDFLPELGESTAIGLLERVLARLEDLPALAHAQLLEEALGVAGHFGDAPLVQRALAALVPLLRTVSTEHASELASVVASALRALRRVGLRDEAATLLRTVADVAKGDDVGAVVARVHVAGGLAYLGREDEARPHLDLALLRLAQANSPVHDRLTLARALSRALGHSREDLALAALRRMEGELARVTDSYNTNSHFCLSVVAYVEALVLGYASEELVLGELGRRYLDEDEHLVRRRIQRDLAR